MDEDTAQALIHLRRELPTASVTTLIGEMMQRRVTSLDVILKAPTVCRFLHQKSNDGQISHPTCCWSSPMSVLHGGVSPMYRPGGRTRTTAPFARPA
ncbi:hypothetical protein DFAR_3600007 [Desulfarculales bacterium]